MNRNGFRRLNVLVRHAEPLLAVGLVAALRQQPDFEVLVHGVDDLAACEAVDVVVADYEAGLELAAEGPRHARVMVVTLNSREQEIRVALQGGVHGYLLLGCGLDELAAGVRTVGLGSRYLCLAAAQRIAESMTREALTAREDDVLRLLALGHGNKAIARELGIAIGTVKAHMKGIMQKLDAASRTEAASIAVRRGLLELPAHSTWRDVRSPRRDAQAA